MDTNFDFWNNIYFQFHVHWSFPLPLITKKIALFDDQIFQIFLTSVFGKSTISTDVKSCRNLLKWWFLNAAELQRYCINHFWIALHPTSPIHSLKVYGSFSVIGDRIQMHQGCRATTRKQFTSDHEGRRSLWYSSDKPRKDERLTRQSSHQVVLNRGHLERKHGHLAIAPYFFLIGIHSMQGWTATKRHRAARKRSAKRLKHTGNLFRKNLQLIGVC